VQWRSEALGTPDALAALTLEADGAGGQTLPAGVFVTVGAKEGLVAGLAGGARAGGGGGASRGAGPGGSARVGGVGAGAGGAGEEGAGVATEVGRVEGAALQHLPLWFDERFASASAGVGAPGRPGGGAADGAGTGAGAGAETEAKAWREEGARAVRDCSVLVGLHPDQAGPAPSRAPGWRGARRRAWAGGWLTSGGWLTCWERYRQATDAIVDVALSLDKPFAVVPPPPPPRPPCRSRYCELTARPPPWLVQVPCCVFPRDNPHRRLAGAPRPAPPCLAPRLRPAASPPRRLRVACAPV